MKIGVIGAGAPPNLSPTPTFIELYPVNVPINAGHAIFANGTDFSSVE